MLNYNELYYIIINVNIITILALFKKKHVYEKRHFVGGKAFLTSL